MGYRRLERRTTIGIGLGSGRCGIDETADLALESGESFPVSEGMAIDGESSGDRGGGFTGDQQARGAEMVGDEGTRLARRGG